MITSSRQAILMIVISLYTRTVLGYCFSFGGGKELKMMKEKKNYLFAIFLIHSKFSFCLLSSYLVYITEKKSLNKAKLCQCDIVLTCNSISSIKGSQIMIYFNFQVIYIDPISDDFYKLFNELNEHIENSVPAR